MGFLAVILGRQPASHVQKETVRFCVMRIWHQFAAVFHMVEEFHALQKRASPLSFRRNGFSVCSEEFNGAMEVFTIWFS